MALNFPDPAAQTPVNEFSPTSTPASTDNGVVYTWTGNKWSAAGSGTYLPISGGELTGDLTVPSLNEGPLSGFRNQIINGNNNIFQRRTSAAVSTSIGYYTADRWYVGGTNGSTNAIAPTGVSGANFPFVWQNTLSAAGQYRQRIELFRNGQNAPFVTNSVWTLSFWSTQPISEISVQFARFIDTNNGTSGSNVTSTALTAIDTQSTWTRYSSKITIDQNAGTDNCFEIAIGFTGASNLTGIQLEPGPVATVFENRPVGIELALAQRYFEIGRTKSYVGGGDSTGIAAATNYKVSKRAVATLFYGTDGAFQYLPSSTEQNYVEGFSSLKNGSKEIAFTWSADAEL